jgi:hypothetical protein
MKDQRRFAPKGGRNKPESVAGLTGISIKFGDDIWTLAMHAELVKKPLSFREIFTASDSASSKKYR